MSVNLRFLVPRAAILNISVILLIILSAQTFTTGNAVAIVAPTGSMSCGTSTTSAITVLLSYNNTGTAGASLYRKGAPGSGQVAFFPGANGTGSHSDNGLSGTYEYQLRSGTTVLVAKLSCSTKTQPVPAPAPAPSPAPAPAPRLTPPAPAAAPAAPVAPAPAPAPTPAPPTSPIQDMTIDSPRPETDVFVPTTESDNNPTPPTKSVIVEPETSSASGLSRILPYLIGLVGLAILGFVVYLLSRRRQRPAPIVTKDPDAVPEISPIMPVTLPAPLIASTSNLFSELIPVPVEKANNNKKFDRSINNAFYPTMPIAAATTVPKADDIPDMYTIAKEHPGSYGSTSYIDDKKQDPTDLIGIPFRR